MPSLHPLVVTYPICFAYLSKETGIVMEGVTTILQGDPDHYQDLSPLGVTGQ